jgi:tRNA (cytidine/uridine-2'-O-)-methyltransferase
MFHIILFEPEIPPNTGNVMRLCANTGCSLHLVHPLGFEIDDKRMRRAGLDYLDWQNVQQHANYIELLSTCNFNRIFACSTKGQTSYAQPNYRAGDAFIFGPETRGLPDRVLKTFAKEQILRIPMIPDSRSLNLSNTVAIFIYEAWRQLDFSGAC